MEDKLRQWGFDQYIAKFEDEEVTLEALLCMSEETLSTLVPKAGPRSLLLARIQELRYEQQHVNKLVSNAMVDSSCASSGTDLPIPMFIIKENPPINVNDVNSDVSQSSILLIPESTTDLQDILSKHALGRALCDFKSLDADKRKLLVDILANDMIMKFERPSKVHYLAYAKAVTNYFPSETIDTYYVPSTNKLTPRGKLYFKVVNINIKRKKLGNLPDLPANQVTGRRRQSDSIDLSHLDAIDEGSVDKYDEMFLWLQTNRQPEIELIEYWRGTAKKRLQYIHGDRRPELADILKLWPRYKDADGFHLISEDFSLLYPGCADKMADVWPQIYTGVMNKLPRCRARDKRLLEGLKVISCFAEKLEAADIEVALTLLLLPLLLPEAQLTITEGTKSRKPRCRKRKFWKPTFAESMGYFVDVQEVGLDLKKHLEKKENEMSNKGLKLQPHVVVVCSGLETIGSPSASHFACINCSVFFSTPSLMEAVDVCFKAAIVFGLDFPAASHSSWCFVQRTVYGITNPGDRISSRALELITDIK